MASSRIFMENRLVIVVMLVILAALSSASNAWSIPSKSYIDTVQETISGDFVLRVIQVSTRVRALGIADADLINKTFSDDASRTALISKNGQKEQQHSKILLSYFFRGTQIYFGNMRGDAVVIGYFNPIVDYWMITYWDNLGPQPILRKSFFVQGAEFRKGDTKKTTSNNHLPQWFAEAGKKPIIKNLSTLSRDSVDGFERTYQLSSNKNPNNVSFHSSEENSKKVFIARLDVLFQTLFHVQENKSLSKSYVAMIDGISSGDILAVSRLFKGPNEADVAKICSFPAYFRNNLEPYAVIVGKDVIIIISSRIENSRWFLVSAFGDVPDGRAQLQLHGLAYLDVFAE